MMMMKMSHRERGERIKQAVVVSARLSFTYLSDCGILVVMGGKTGPRSRKKVAYRLKLKSDIVTEVNQ